ncbi:MAG TPA: hypothetical protein RMG45_03935, partial [Polyangiaceae bacterium LLY-WYZ-15_(1-7)]|nr:hypothetical protein [Polyangiaceae bacterium LLY-WYZ-15_(1-7)]
PPALEAAAKGETVGLGAYLDLDDAALLHSFHRWQSSPDPLLAELASRLQTRRLPKTVPLPADERGWAEIHARASEVVRSAGDRADLRVFLDVASDVPYSEPAGASTEGLWVLISHRPIQRLGDCSFLLHQLRGKRVRHPRLIFPARHRERVLDAIGELLAPDATPLEDLA